MKLTIIKNGNTNTRTKVHYDEYDPPGSLDGIIFYVLHPSGEQQTHTAVPEKGRTARYRHNLVERSPKPSRTETFRLEGPKFNEIDEDGTIGARGAPDRERAPTFPSRRSDNAASDTIRRTRPVICESETEGANEIVITFAEPRKEKINKRRTKKKNGDARD